jgi:hypothetical protein
MDQERLSDPMPRRDISSGESSRRADNFGEARVACRTGGGEAFQPGDVSASTAALGPALLGTAAGGAMPSRFSEQTFRRIFFGGLLALGAYLASRALF